MHRTHHHDCIYPRLAARRPGFPVVVLDMNGVLVYRTHQFKGHVRPDIVNFLHCLHSFADVAVWSSMGTTTLSYWISRLLPDTDDFFVGVWDGHSCTCDYDRIDWRGVPHVEKPLSVVREGLGERDVEIIIVDDSVSKFCGDDRNHLLLVPTWNQVEEECCECVDDRFSPVSSSSAIILRALKCVCENHSVPIVESLKEHQIIPHD